MRVRATELELAGYQNEEGLAAALMETDGIAA